MFHWYPPAAHTKFGSAWTGPYLVINKISDLVYQIQASERSKPKVVHLDHLKPYYPNDSEELVNWLEEPTGTGTTERLLESLEDAAGGLLTQLEEEVVSDKSRDLEDGYSVDSSEDDSDPGHHRKDRGSSGAELIGLEPLRRSKRTIRHPRRYLMRVA